MRTWKGLLGFFVILVLVSCGSLPATEDSDFVMPSPRPPMTLAPTFTPAATLGPLPTITPPPAQETAVPDTPIPFDETVLQLRYQIPLLGLDRRLQANLANQIIVVDEASGRSIQRNNEGVNLFELRQALSDIELASMPNDCSGCVYVEYELTDAGVSDSGWLQDPILLASIENFMSATLEPHFPDGSVIGLRRSASPFVPGHSIAITADGRLWMWLATEDQVSPSVATEATFAPLAELAQIPIDKLAQQYQADCRGVPIETVYLVQADESWQGRLVCPQLTLPTTLQPLYLQLDDLLLEKTADVSVTEPDSAFPIDALLQYSRSDNSVLQLYTDSSLIATDPFGVVFTRTLTSTLPVSLTTTILDAGILAPGFKSFTAAEPITATVTAESPRFVLAVRGPDGVYDGEWAALPDIEIFSELNRILDSIISVSPEPEVIEETPENGETVDEDSRGTPDPVVVTPTP